MEGLGCCLNPREAGDYKRIKILTIIKSFFSRIGEIVKKRKKQIWKWN